MSLTQRGNMTKQILIVEDEQKLADLLSDYFALAQFQTHCLDDGDLVIEWVKGHQPDVILLDIMLPNKDGITICRELRQFTNVPILMVTAKVEEIDRLLGLEIGADDYICKPFSPREVVARVKAVLRRANTIAPVETQGEFLLDDKRLQLCFNGKSVDLTAVEFHLIQTMFSEPRRIFTREQLMRNMYDDSRIVSDRTIDSHIKKLRKKLVELNPEQGVIQSVYGVGYRVEFN